MSRSRFALAVAAAATITLFAWSGPTDSSASQAPAAARTGAAGRAAVGTRPAGATSLTARVVSTAGYVSAQSFAGPAFYTYQAPGGAATRGQKVIALTFDDGPGPYTPQVLSVLQTYHVPATFFEIGIEATKYPQYTRDVAAAGYPVEDHTWTHADLTTIPASEFPYQIDQTQSELKSLTDRTPQCVRPPYNAFNSTVVSQMAERGLTLMSYSIDPKDWTRPGTQAIVSRVVGAAFPGAVVDMHDAGGDRSETVAALPAIINQLRADGYQFVSICGSSQVRSHIASFGSAPAPGTAVTSDHGFVAAAASRSGGYWLAASDGGVFALDHAPFYGSLGNVKLTKPIVGMAANPNGPGYWLVASDGGIFAFGHAPFYGSLGNVKLTKPIVGVAASRKVAGYWLVASDGGVFSFGRAAFHGSLGATHLSAPIVGAAGDPLTGGYWLLGADGGVFAFDSRFLGSASRPGSAFQYFAIVATSGGAGYLVAGAGPL